MLKSLRSFLYIVTCIFISLASVSCSRPVGSGISAEALIAEMTAPAGFATPARENLLDPLTAAKYGLRTGDLADGCVLYDSRPAVGGKIIIAVAAGDEEITRVEKALSAERAKLVEALDSTGRDGTLREIKVKTKGRYCILIFCTGARDIEAIFDDFVKT